MDDGDLSRAMPIRASHQIKVLTRIERFKSAPFLESPEIDPKLQKPLLGLGEA